MCDPGLPGGTALPPISVRASRRRNDCTVSRDGVTNRVTRSEILARERLWPVPVEASYLRNSATALMAIATVTRDSVKTAANRKYLVNRAMRDA